MPTYVYCCDACDLEMDQFQKITASALTTCPKCEKESLYRRPSGGIGLSFKGSGFYITDYQMKEKGGSKESETAGSASSDVTSSATSNSSSSATTSNATSTSQGCCPCGTGNC